MVSKQGEKLSFILDEVERGELNRLRARNREIVKFWGRRQGFENMQFKYIMDEGNQYGQKVVSKMGQDLHDFLRSLRTIMRGRTSPIELLLHKEESGEWLAVSIVDEFEIVFRLAREGYSEAADLIMDHSNCRIVLIPFKQSGEYVGKLLQTYNERTGRSVTPQGDFYVLKAEVLGEKEA